MKLRINIVIALLCLAYLALEWVNGRAQMADFRVYYDAAHALTHGDTLYGKAFGVSSGFYKYSPFACLPFVPLTWLPYAAASMVYYGLLTIALIFFLWRVSDTVCADEKKPLVAVTLLTGLFLIDHLERELHLGNINLFLLMALFEVYHLLMRKQDGKAGLLYGLVLLFKPHFLLLLPYFIWKRKFLTVTSSVGCVVVGLMLPALGLGWDQNVRLLRFWMLTIGDHNVALQHSPNTLYGLINRLFMDGLGGPRIILIILGAVAFLTALGLWMNDRRHGEHWSRIVRYEEYFVLIGIVPNLVHTDTEHFMWVWPMLALAMRKVLNPHTGFRKPAIGMLLLAFVPFALNSPDLVGTQVQLLFDEGGIGLANLIILLIGIAL